MDDSSLNDSKQLKAAKVEQTAVIRYVERAFLSAQLSKYSAILFTLISLTILPLTEIIWFPLGGLIWIAIAFWRQKEAQDKLQALEAELMQLENQ